MASDVLLLSLVVTAAFLFRIGFISRLVAVIAGMTLIYDFNLRGACVRTRVFRELWRSCSAWIFVSCMFPIGRMDESARLVVFVDIQKNKIFTK